MGTGEEHDCRTQTRWEGLDREGGEGPVQGTGPEALTDPARLGSRGPGIGMARGGGLGRVGVYRTGRTEGTTTGSGFV